MAHTKRTDRLTINGLSDDDQAWLKTEAERLGCDPENLVRMMIRQRSAAVVVPLGAQPQSQQHYRPPPDFREWATQPNEILDDIPMQKAPDYRMQAAIDTPAEPSLDDVMGAPPPLAIGDKVPLSQIRKTQRQGLPFFNRGNLHNSPRPPAGPGGAFSAFSETEFVGVDQSFIGMNALGDGKGNVMRDNLRHFGVAGTRSR